MVRQFIVTLMNLSGLRTLVVNCNDRISAQRIAEGIYEGKGFRVIEVSEYMA